MRYHFSTFSTKKGSMYLNNTTTLAICNFKLFAKFERSISQLYLYGEYNTKSNLFSLFQENVFSSNNEHILRNENSKTQWEKKKSLSKLLLSEMSKMQRYFPSTSISHWRKDMGVCWWNLRSFPHPSLQRLCPQGAQRSSGCSSWPTLQGSEHGQTLTSLLLGMHVYTHQVPCAPLPQDNPCLLCGWSTAFEVLFFVKL